MALSAFSKNFAMYDVTPVENLFLLEYMPYAPGDYVRVYLYGLMQCHHPDPSVTLEGMARALSLKVDEVMDAFRYWEQKGLIIGVSDSPPSFEYVNVRTALLDGQGADHDGAYQYRDFINQLQQTLGILHPQQLSAAMEWVEDLRLPCEVVLTMVREKSAQLKRQSGKKRSTGYLFKVFGQMALDWAQRDIRTVEAAERELSRGTAEYRLASHVCDYLNLRRAPTEAEVQLTKKWLEEWSLSEKAVDRALKETTASASPSFAYVDGILSRLRDAPENAAERLDEDRALYESTRQLLAELGASARTPGAAQLESVRMWLDEGFEQSALMLAAAHCRDKNRNTFSDLGAELGRWRRLGVTTLAAAGEYKKARALLREQTGQVFSRAGIDRRPTEADMDQMKEWLKTAPFEVILYAAGLANGLTLPTRSIAKNLAAWARLGVRDVSAAQAEYEARSASGPRKAARPAPANARPDEPQSQPRYENSFFDDFFEDLDKPKGGNQP